MAASYGHKCTYHDYMGGYYRLTWIVDFKHPGSRLRFPRTFIRDTDEAGARKFCKKWNIDMPSNAPAA